ncbi:MULTISPECIES: copper resistance CopC family protein [unclassified Arthrobacter]|uniref:copper resistance CopC family protein n=1 Tax=unclassified Arthrobacter TaxID=235627 RepID=UPI002E066FB2|nr:MULTISPECIES: copper resistance CopC family protein [unclassified Arthrobacter]MEC5192550.1 methionine-rich copper-binding protein CopC [Arthrobacter sp. MP_M4]MEC5204034.1 methionine-rich copper-binding protein CopC [Arthrobacter sp. MP_M7]
MRLIRLFVSALLGAAIFSATLLGAIAPASAHDAAESTSPVSGATVATPPEKVSVTFNNKPLGLGSQIAVNHTDGANWADGGVEIVDNVASQKLKPGAPAGLYTVGWRVASSDGHPIEGTFTFTATAGAAGSTAAAAVPTMGTAQPGTTPAPSTPASSAEPFPWSLVIFVGTAIGIVVALGLMAKSRLKTDSGKDAAS